MAVTTRIAGLALLLALAAPVLGADEPWIRGASVDLDRGIGVEVERSPARRVGRLLDDTFDTARRLLLLERRDIYHSGRLRPAWLCAVDGDEPKLRGVIEGEVLPIEPGLVACLRRLRAGQMTVPIPSPADGWDDADVEACRSEIAAAVVGSTLGDGAPLWLAHGLADALPEALAEGETTTTRGHRAELAKGDFALPWSMLFTTTDRVDFEANRGRALAWAAVRLLRETNPKFLLRLYHQIRLLARHAFTEPAPGTIRKDLTAVALASMKQAGVDPKELGRLAAAWAKAGFPSGAELRKLPGAKALGAVKRPEAYGVSLRGVIDGIDFQQGKMASGPVVWRLPWRSRMRLWVAPNSTIDSVRLSEAGPGAMSRFVTHGQLEWDAEPEGRQQARIIEPGTDFSMGLGLGNASRAVVLLAVRSPSGAGWFFAAEWRFE
jgi:hypothetical protein